jgi:peptidoglycan/LPS O-acetylase OafA/YrhL
MAQLMNRSPLRDIPSSRIAYLDGIRALAIGGVVAVHWVSPYFPLLLGGYIGVDLFFVLSGYIITTVLWRSRAPVSSVWSGWFSFIRRRGRRLYPGLLGLLIGGTLIYMVAPGPLTASEVSSHAIISGMQLSSIWLAMQAGMLAPFGQTWSLAIEWYFYLLWPIAVFLCRRRGMRPRRLAGLSVLAGLGIYGTSLFQDAHWFYYGPAARFAELLFGAAVALVLLSLPDLPRIVSPKLQILLGPVAVASLALYVIFGPVQWDPVFRIVGIPLAVMATSYLILSGAQGNTDPAIRFLSLRPITLLGRISYSLYLCHLLAIDLLDKDMIPLPLPVLAVLGVSSSLVLTWVCYTMLERPFIRSHGEALRQVPVIA